MEDQQQFVVPLTRETESLFYNLRMIIDNKVLTEPRAWHITKVNRLEADGLTRITLAQDRFDQHKDYIEFDENGNVIGMWADYYAEGQAEPTDADEKMPNLYSVTEYSGLKPEIKVGGGYKTLTTTFFRNGEEVVPYACTWSFAIKDGETVTPVDDPSTLVNVVGLSGNQMKVKFLGDDSYISKALIITSTADTHWGAVVSNVEFDIRGL